MSGLRYSRVSRKGQITIPAAIRRKLGLQTGIVSS
jgi:AbrB family looped-hinge helix DNA binding protein